MWRCEMKQTANRRKRGAAGVTLIEMLVVVTIIGLFVALVGPRLWSNVDKAKITAARARMLVEALRHENVRAQNHRAPPEGAQQLALDPDVPDVLGILRRGNRRDLPIENDPNRRRRRAAETDLLGRAVQVAWREVPVLSFASIHRQLDRVAIGAVERLVAVQHGLHVVLPRFQVREAAHRVAKRVFVHSGRYEK